MVLMLPNVGMKCWYERKDSNSEGKEENPLKLV